MNLSVRHMRAFVALANARNFTRAAEECSLTQSAFSALIANLEAGLGLRLFSRNTRNVELTSEGEAFLDLVKTLLPETERALELMRDQAALRRGKVAVAALPTICSSILPPILAHFQSLHPGIELIIEDAANAACVEHVRHRRMDFALCAATYQGSELIMETLASDRFHFVCHRSHPLAGRSRLDYGEVQASHPITVYDRASSIRQHLDAAIYPLQWRRSYEVNNLSTAAGLVGAGLGATIIPTLGVRQFRSPDLRIIPIDLPIERRGICLLRHKHREPSLAAAAFMTVIRERFAQELEALYADAFPIERFS